MTDRREACIFWLAAVSTVACAVGGYLIFETSLPLCGPPRNTFLGRIYWYVPLALLIAQSGVVVLAGRKMHRSSAVLTALGVALIVALIGDVVVFFAYFAAGNCGE